MEQSFTDAGTLVPMQLEMVPNGQSTPFAALIELFPLEDCVSIIKWAVRDYYTTFLVNDGEVHNQEEDPDLGSPAVQTLLALFANHLDFENNPAAEEFLQDLQRADDPDILGLLLDSTHELYVKLSTLVNRGPMLAHSATELGEQIEPFVQTVRNALIEIDKDVYLEASVWPFVKLARYVAVFQLGSPC
jgi:hypothetical protein